MPNINIIRPRVNDYYNVPLTQSQVDFAIPFLEEDIPLYVDPFLLFKSPSMQDNSLHTVLISSFNSLGFLFNNKHQNDAVEILMEASECSEVGLGVSKDKHGLKIGKKKSLEILNLFASIPQVQNNGFGHLEEIQMLVSEIAKDRISDIACSLLKSFLIDFTIENAEKYNIPMFKYDCVRVYDCRKNKFIDETIYLPQNPNSSIPILFVPKRWLRYIPWINYEDYFDSFYIKNIDEKIEKNELGRIKILEYNRQNYGMIEGYIKSKEKEQSCCINDPLFKQIPILSAKRHLSRFKKLPTGKANNADKEYEKIIEQLFASLLYPDLDFADAQSRTDSGAQIRDLIFYNNRSNPFLADIYDQYESRQIIMEIKNVNEIEREHINQLNRYMTDNLGRFGIIITRNRIKKSIQKNIIDLWSGQRRCILVLTDDDIEMMVDIFEQKQRIPLDVLKKVFIEFSRRCPS